MLLIAGFAGLLLMVMASVVVVWMRVSNRSGYIAVGRGDDQDEEDGVEEQSAAATSRGAEDSNNSLQDHHHSSFVTNGGGDGEGVWIGLLEAEEKRQHPQVKTHHHRSRALSNTVDSTPVSASASSNESMEFALLARALK